jgi:hypothetical protein
MLPDLVLGINICIVLEQHLHHIEKPILGRYHNCRKSMLQGEDKWLKNYYGGY